MKKKIILACLAVSVAAGLCGCGSKKVSYDFNLDEYVTVGKYKGLEVSADEIQTEYDSTITSLQSQYTTSETVTDRGIQEDDSVSVDYTLTSGDTELESQQSYTVTVGSGSKDFENSLIGHVTDDTYTETVTLPDDYSNADYAGAEATYSITVGKITAYDDPEIDDAFIAEKYSDKYSSYAEFETATRKNIKEELLWDMVTEDSEILKYPEKNIRTYYDNYINYYTNMYQSYANSMNTTIESVYSMMGTSAQQIYKQSADAAKSDVVKEMLALSIANAENIVIDDDSYTSRLEEMYSDYGYDSAKAMEKAVGKEAIKRIMIEQDVLQMINDNSTEI